MLKISSGSHYITKDNFQAIRDVIPAFFLASSPAPSFQLSYLLVHFSKYSSCLHTSMLPSACNSLLAHHYPDKPGPIVKV